MTTTYGGRPLDRRYYKEEYLKQLNIIQKSRFKFKNMEKNVKEASNFNEESNKGRNSGG